MLCNNLSGKKNNNKICYFASFCSEVILFHSATHKLKIKHCAPFVSAMNMTDAASDIILFDKSAILFWKTVLAYRIEQFWAI